MGFWTIFKADTETELFRNTLHQELLEVIKNKEDDHLTIIACVAGLLAHMAFADLEVDERELEKIKEILNNDPQFGADEVDVIAGIAINHASEFAGLENHLLTKPLIELMSQQERFDLLKSLFQVAASDGSVSALEAEESRIIAKGLNLSNQHYLAARALVIEHIEALK